MNELKFGNGRPLSLRARVSGALTAILEETPIATDQRLKPECAGAHRLSATIPESWQLNGWVLQQGAHGTRPPPQPLNGLTHSDILFIRYIVALGMLAGSVKV